MQLQDIKQEFLHLPVGLWDHNVSYNTARLNVNNDGSERGVKLSSDYLKCTKFEDNYQNVLQVVDGDWKLVTS